MHFHVPLGTSRATASDSDNKVVTFPLLYLIKNYEFKNVSINVEKFILIQFIQFNLYIIFILRKILIYILLNVNFQIGYILYNRL